MFLQNINTSNAPGNYHWIDNHLVKATRYKGKFTDLVEKEVTIQVFDDGKNV